MPDTVMEPIQAMQKEFSFGPDAASKKNASKAQKKQLDKEN